MPKIFYTLINLVRLNKPVGYFLVFFPSLFGLLLAYKEPVDLYYIPVIFIGSILTRSAGCIINDYFDRNFDKQVLRTKNRPLANGTISKKVALIIFIFLLFFSALILLNFKFIAIIIGIVAFCMIIIYPLMKRFTYFPQIFLGITLNLGSLISYTEIRENISLEILLIYIACVFWTLGYDTIYAFIDLKYDKAIGIKSSAIFLYNKNYKYKIFIYFSYIIFLSLYMIANILVNNRIGLIGGLISVPLLFYQVKNLDITSYKNCIKSFESNILVGLLMAVSMLVGCIA